MYNFIYYFFYQFFLWKKDNDPKDSAIYALMVAIFFHGFFLVALLNYVTNRNFLVEIFGAEHSKFYWIPFVSLIMYFIHKRFKKKSELILTKYDGKSVLTVMNILLIFVVVVGPLIIGIQLLNND